MYPSQSLGAQLWGEAHAVQAAQSQATWGYKLPSLELGKQKCVQWHWNLCVHHTAR